jgi:membrane protein implicated in regulation of membrane protease activity
MTCGFRQARECGCPAEACAVQPVTPAPVVLISLKTQAIVCLFLGFVMAIGSAAWMEAKLKTDDRTNQEASVQWKP